MQGLVGLAMVRGAWKANSTNDFDSFGWQNRVDTLQNYGNHGLPKKNWVDFPNLHFLCQ